MASAVNLNQSGEASDPESQAYRPTRDQRREKILAVAHTVFLEHGFEGTSMSQVAALLGGSKGTLYNYFDSKEVLFEALVTDSCARRQAAIFDAVPSLPLVPRLTAIAVAYVTLVASDWAIRMMQVVSAEARRRPEVGRIFYAAGPGAGLVHLRRHLDGFVADGSLAADDTGVAAETFLALCRGHYHMRRMLGQEPAPTPAVIEAEATRAVGLFLKLYGTG